LPRVSQLDVSVYRIPTDRPEADGTFSWDATTMVLVEAVADSGERGLGYTYTAGAAAAIVRALLAPAVVGRAVDDVGAAWEAIGSDAALFVDANGAYQPKQAVDQAHRFAEHGVTYFEEPVSSDHRDALAFVREQAPVAVAASEYGLDPWYFRDMLRAGAVDILQTDATRCLGVTGWLEAAQLAHGFAMPFSAHCAPSIHAQIGCAAPELAHVEYFHDHVRIERMLIDGRLEPEDGRLRPDPTLPGLGLELKRADAERWRIDA
jgi:L-alanine-DL-glutamate epimerase-like enolase superfamily enzyme